MTVNQIASYSFATAVGLTAFASTGSSQEMKLDANALEAVHGELASRAGQSSFIADANNQITADILAHGQRQDVLLKALNLSSGELDDSTAPWEMFAKSLRLLYNNDPNWKGMQVLGLPLAADWDDDTLGKWRKWRLYGDTIPAWGASYIPTSMQVSKGYEILIDNIAIPQPDPAQQAKADTARLEYNKQLGILENLQEQAGNHWKVFDAKQKGLPPPRRLTFDQWYATYDGRIIGQQQIKTNGAAQAFQSYINAAYKGYGWAANLVTDFNNVAFQQAAQSDDGTSLFYRTYNFSPDLKQWIADSTALPAGCTKLTIAYDHTTHHDHSEDESWSGGATLGFGFFSFGASASGGRQTVNVNDNGFAMSFCAKNLALFTIQPSGWFNGTAVAAFANGPWVPGGPVANGTIKLWGPDGVLNLMPTQILVAFQPKVVAQLSSHDYAMVHTSFNAGGGFSIGPFGFGGSYHKDTKDVTWDDAHNTVTAEDKSNVPQIIAVISNRLPNNK
jgi:hypothetical protein